MQIHPFTQPCQGTLARPMVSLAIAHDLQLRRQNCADRSVFFGGEDASLAPELSVQFQSDVRLSDVRLHIARIKVQHHFTCLLRLTVKRAFGPPHG
jgi:hypothetical protein